MLRQAAHRFGEQSAFAAMSPRLLDSLHHRPSSSLVSLLSLTDTLRPQQCCYTTNQNCTGPANRHNCNGWQQPNWTALHKNTSNQHSRQLATESQTAADTEYPIVRPDHIFVYKGPLAQTVSRLKKLSLFSCACAFTASPIIIYMSAATAMGAKASIAFTLCGFGAFTTGLAEVETLTLFAKHQRRTFSQSEVQVPQTMKPQATFQVHGQVYYLDADNFKDKDLLARLTPKEPEIVPSK